MEIIELSSYTENEKYHIAVNYLIEKQRKANGIKKKQIDIPDDVIYELIRSYTREAGVRELERKIGRLMRKAARQVIEDGGCLYVTVDQLPDLLGMVPLSREDRDFEPQVGVARGLAWTSVGGDTLSIEVNIMPGKGKVVLTGRMGDVMKESAQIGLSYIRSIAGQYQVEADYFEKNDVHLHIPEGAVPKDGPSAGITMALAMLSAMTSKEVRGDVAMTGEITLRGRVLPVGGLKEKLLAAKAAGIKEVIVPDQNRSHIADLESEITEGLTIHYVKHMDEVLTIALAGGQIPG
jgi:ATP-dependent Lon protease